MPPIAIKGFGNFQNRFVDRRTERIFVVLAEFEAGIESADVFEQIAADRFQIPRQHPDIEQAVDGIFVAPEAEDGAALVDVGYRGGDVTAAGEAFDIVAQDGQRVGLDLVVTVEKQEPSVAPVADAAVQRIDDAAIAVGADVADDGQQAFRDSAREVLLRYEGVVVDHQPFEGRPVFLVRDGGGGSGGRSWWRWGANARRRAGRGAPETGGVSRGVRGAVRALPEWWGAGVGGWRWCLAVGTVRWRAFVPFAGGTPALPGGVWRWRCLVAGGGPQGLEPWIL